MKSMIENKLEEILNIVDKLNSKCSKSIISSQELEEQSSNLNDFKKLNLELDDYIKNLKNLDCENVEEVISNFLAIHLRMTRFIYYLDIFEENIIKNFIGQYRESINSDKTNKAK